jgi:hypothetical protein
MDWWVRACKNNLIQVMQEKQLIINGNQALLIMILVAKLLAHQTWSLNERNNSASSTVM